MDENSIYRVTREDYKAFMEQLKPECRDIKTIDLHSKLITKVLSKTTGECLCSRVTYSNEKEREKYYIFKMPLDSERRAPVPHVRVELKDQKEVQAFFDAYYKLQKEKKNEGTV